MVSEFGMSKQIGPFAVVRRETGAFLPGFGEQALTGPDVQRVIDEEVKRIVEENYSRAIQILESNRHILETLAQELLDSEDMDGAHLQKRLKELGATLPEKETVPEREVL